MKILVAVKQVPDTSEVSVDENGSLVRAGVPSILDPYCEYALRKALSLKEKGDEVIAFTMGPPQAESALRRCLCLGADRACLLTDRAFAGADTWATSRAIAAFVQRHGCDADLLVFGQKASDGETGQVPFEVAQMLSVQQFAYAKDIERCKGSFLVTQDYGDVLRDCRVPRGSVVAFSDVDPCGTLMSISQRLEGAGKPVETMDRVGLGLGLYSVGLKGSRTKIVKTGTNDVRRKNRKAVVGDPSRVAELLKGEMEARV